MLDQLESDCGLFLFNHSFPTRPSSLPGVPSPLSLSPQDKNRTGNPISASFCGNSTTPAEATLQRRLPKLALLPRAPPHGPSEAKCACPVRAACPRPASAPPLLAGSSRAAGVWPPPPSAPRGHYERAHLLAQRNPGQGGLSELRLTWRLRVWLRETLGESAVCSRGCAGRISGKRVGWEVIIREKEVG